MFKIDTLARLTLSTGLVATLALVTLAGCASSSDASQNVTPAAEEAVDTTETAEADETAAVTPVWAATTYKLSQVFSDGSTSEFSSTYELDDAGNMISETGDEGSQFKYTYDEDGWLTKVEMGDEAWTYELEKDELGRVVAEKSEDYRVEYSYNEQGFVSESRSTSIVFTVDEDGNRVEGSEETMTSKTTYDEDGFTLARTRTFKGGKAEMVYAYEYGDDGLPVSYTATTKNYDSDGNEIADSETTVSGTFEYDEHGNIVKRVIEDDLGTSTYEYTYVEIKNPSQAVRIQGHTKNV